MDLGNIAAAILLGFLLSFASAAPGSDANLAAAAGDVVREQLLRTYAFLGLEERIDEVDLDGRVNASA